MAILRFSKWLPSAILDFWNSNFLTVAATKRPILHQRTKYRKDWSNRCVDFAIFVIFKMAAAATLYYQKFKILTIICCTGSICVTVPNFIKIHQTVAQIWRFNGFFKMWPSTVLDLLSRLGTPTMTTWWSLSLCKVWLKSMLSSQ